MRCDCGGSLGITESVEKGLGGSQVLYMKCSSCNDELRFCSSSTIPGTKRLLAPTLAMIGHIFSGNQYGDYQKSMGAVIGEYVFSDNAWLMFLEWIEPIIKSLLDKQCELAKESMKKLPDTQIGSFKRAVTTSDGCWQIRGHSSPNATFVIIDYYSHGLLYYKNLSMKGRDKSELWEGTSKSAEGYMADVLFGQAKNEGMIVEVNFQDADSSSMNSLKKHFPTADYLCGGHLARAHGNQLEAISKMKTHESLPGLTCKCKRHSKKCGCLTESFLLNAKINFFSALKSCGTSAAEFEKTIKKKL